MEALTSQVVTWLKDNGANLAGISPVERFDGALKGHHPSDFVPKAKTVVAFGVALLHHAVYWERHLADSEIVPPENRKDVLLKLLYLETGYAKVNDLLDMLALRVANFLEGLGYRSLFFPATYSSESVEFMRARIPSFFGLFSQRHAAVMAGLGEFGLNNVVVTPEYGPRIRLNSVITEAELIPSALISKKVCLGEGCGLCIKNCPGAISLRPGFDPQAVWYVPPSRTDIKACCLKLHPVHYCMGRCIKVCPVGNKIQGDM